MLNWSGIFAYRSEKCIHILKENPQRETLQILLFLSIDAVAFKALKRCAQIQHSRKQSDIFKQTEGGKKAACACMLFPSPDDSQDDSRQGA